MDVQQIGISLFVAFSLHFPFGFYGARFKRFTKPWGRCLYIPILFTIFLRRYMLIGYTFIPFFVIIALAGQVLGKTMGRHFLTTDFNGNT